MLFSRAHPRSNLRQFVNRVQINSHSRSTARYSASARTMAQEFKLKDLKSLDLKKGESREVEVEGVEEGKVLLCNVGGKITAIGNKCTHYGAPLVKGVLTGDGRITCPWHGACFKAPNGDIENAPALDALPSFGLSEKNGGVYITGEKESIKSSRRKPNVKRSSAAQVKGDEKVVVVGGGSAALATVEALRENGFSGGITMIGNEGYLPIDRTKLSKALIPDPAKLAWRDEAWFKGADIDVVFSSVTDVDFPAKIVTTESGSTLPYTKLVLATGGSPKHLPLPGFKELGNIFVLRTAKDAQGIVSAIGNKGKKIVVIGSSFIGMEAGNAAANDNTVSIIGMEKAPLERVMGEKVGKIFQKNLEGNGVKFYLNAGVEKALPSTSDSSKVGYVQLKDGTKLEADLVILGIGVGPATTFLKDNKAVKLEKDGSLRVDENFVVEGLKDVYAVGDIATYPYHGPGGNGSKIRIEHWNVAQNQGRGAAAHINNPSEPSKPFIPIFWSALGGQLRYCGNTVGGYDDIVLKGQPDEGKFSAYYTKGETVVAVATMQMDPIMAQSSELMRRGKMPSKSELQNGADVMTIEVPAEVTI